jgi:hypothetical protein
MVLDQFDLHLVTGAHLHSAYEFYAHLLVAELRWDSGRQDCDQSSSAKR